MLPEGMELDWDQVGLLGGFKFVGAMGVAAKTDTVENTKKNKKAAAIMMLCVFFDLERLKRHTKGKLEYSTDTDMLNPS